jgi:CubicO group peptidase (beta-lactamase class C family)
MRRKHVVLFFVVIALIFATAAENRAALRGKAGDLDARIQRIENGLIPNPGYAIKGRPPLTAGLSARMKDYKVPGVSIAVMNNFKIEWVKGYGVKEAGRNDPVTPETLFQAASISKPVSAAAALHYVEQGLFDLDENVNDKLRSWKVPDNEWTKEKKVTLRGILSHSAGLTVSGFPGYAQGAAMPTLRQILDGEKPANSAPIRVDIEIGSQFRYSGGGYTVLQQLLTDVLGKPYPDIIKETVLDKAGMTNSVYEQPLSEKFMGRESAAHGMNGKPIKGQWHIYPELAAAGLWTTPSDLCRFAIEIMLSQQGKSNKILSPSMVQQMMTLEKAEFGMGIVLRGVGEGLFFTHSGGNAGFRCIFLAFPERGQGAAIMTNGDLGGDLYMEVLRSLAAEYGWPAFKPVERIVAKIDMSLLESYTGTYEFTPANRISILKEGDHLVVDSLPVVPTGRAKCEFYPESESSFFSLKTADIIAFTKDTEGKVTGLIVKQGPRERTASKTK